MIFYGFFLGFSDLYSESGRGGIGLCSGLGAGLGCGCPGLGSFLFVGIVNPV
jgi:hypothetical protein